MDRQEIAAAVRTERLALAEWAEGLDAAGWATPSLCAAWTVREVLAHLTWTTRVTVPTLFREAVRARGSFDRMEERMARERAAAFTPAELVAQLRESADSTRRTPGSGPMDPLMDLVVHAQDVVRPVGRPYRSPAGSVLASLAHVAADRFMGGPKRVAGLALEATDAAWSAGTGPLVRGPAEDLLLVAAGRPAGLAGLDGPGVAVLAGRLRPS